MATDSIVGDILLNVLQVAFNKLASSDFLDFFRARRLDETLQKLNVTLLSINAVINDAEKKQISEDVKAWLDAVKDAAYEAEDLLDEIDTELSKYKMEAEFQASTGKVRNIFSTASASSFDKDFESRMKKCLENLENMASEKDRLGLTEGVGAGLRMVVPNIRQSSSFLFESDICGRNGDKEVIIEWLLSDNDNGNLPSVVSIVGMGGLGKTTVAQLVYNDSKVRDEFELRAWVCVSTDFDVMRVTRSIIEAITMSVSHDDSIDLLQLKLKEILSQKRFLLVLDDLWNENPLPWENLVAPLRYGALGSKILVTTRSDMAASIMGSTKRYHLELLMEEDSWELFSRYAFRRGRDVRHSNPEFEQIGREIIKRCNGLPLALKTIGSLLSTKLSIQEWYRYSSLKSDIEENVIAVLRLSYDCLPSALKRCFAYCSIFPKDYEFDKEELVRLWIAENFLPCTEHKDIKEVGDEFFHYLLSRSLFQRSRNDERHFIMHDLINDMAQHVAGQFCFRWKEGEAYNLPKMIRHFSYIRNSAEASKLLKAICEAKRLRTFLPLGRTDQDYFNMPSSVIHDLLSKLRRLRVLSFSDYSNITELPDSIGNLKHLRYLNLSGIGVKRLPDSICLLHNLQTLNLRYCVSLEKLPPDMHKLINLRNLDFSETNVREMPKQLGNLKNLQFLPSFLVGKYNETSIKQLGELNALETLSILELQNVVDPMEALEAKFKNKIHLEKLMLGWSTNDDRSFNEMHVLEKLQPHQNLKELSISNYGGIKFPFWFADNTLSNVVSLELINCKNCFFLPSLGLLPSLKSLSIIRFDTVEAIGPKFFGNSACTTPFVSLEILRFQEMVRWEEWECSDVSDAFPCLQELHIEKCPRLKEHLPAKLLSLRKLVIDECERLVASIPCAPTIQELVLRNCGKLQMEFIPPTLSNLVIMNCPQVESFLKARGVAIKSEAS